MLVRLVKMHFSTTFAAEFKTVFKSVQPQIAGSKGCTYVQLLQDHSNPEIFFTISHWEDEDHLNAYRNSELFKNVWAGVKPNFRFKAEAWSLLDQ